MLTSCITVEGLANVWANFVRLNAENMWLAWTSAKTKNRGRDTIGFLADSKVAAKMTLKASILTGLFTKEDLVKLSNFLLTPQSPFKAIGAAPKKLPFFHALNVLFVLAAECQKFLYLFFVVFYHTCFACDCRSENVNHFLDRENPIPLKMRDARIQFVISDALLEFVL